MPSSKLEKRRKDKSDRATVDKVLDKRTRRILEKLQARRKLLNLEGSLSTGKEANVYLADACTDLCSKYIKSTHMLCREADVGEDEDGVGGNEEDSERTAAELAPVAIKVYKTSIMPFRDRERYIRSEKRFQRFCTSNPRKLIKLWAEKEVRNLKRLGKAGIPAPEPIYLKNNVLIMQLIGTRLNVAPRIRDAHIEDHEDCYGQCISIISNMYRNAGLVHADMSEYNLLYWENTVYVIDVGQSVEIGHENAQRFLIMDINNINSFFAKKGTDTADGNELYESITGHAIPLCLKGIRIDKDSFIASRVEEVANPEDYAVFEAEDSADELSASAEEPSAETESLCSEEPGGKASDAEGRMERRARKKMVKEANRIRRASRISMKEKKKIFKRYLGRKGKKH
jgi:RIO kinase 1